MARTIYKTEEPVVLEGYQAVLKPSKFGFSLSAIVDQDMADKLETNVLIASSGLSHAEEPKRSV